VSFGSPHRHYRVTDSTNARARELVEAGAPHGTVVTAAEQTAGRGRQGRAWTAPTGKGLLYSAILRPLDERHLLLPLSVPLAVCEAAEALRPGVECAVKWPNDVWVDERKLAGILIEAKPQDGWAVIGVGLNLAVAPDEFPDDLRWPAVSLGGDVEPEGARRALDAALDRWVATERDEVLAAWRSRDALRGREISWEGGSGIADGIEDSGDLVVVAGGDRLVLGAGEVHLRL
jgi:BirA family transcriptional regulator, biotin operon repressor / biotin---[acetyl-CoA-carboxylase] ligase